MKVICSMVMSLDGFIADKDGKTVSGPFDWALFGEQAKRYKNFVIGRGTNRTGSLDNINTEYRVMVSSHPYDNPNFLRAESPEDVIRLLTGKVETILLIGGGKLNASFAKAKLIDELVVTVIPKVMGYGTKIFDGDDITLDFELHKSEVLDNRSMRLTYIVKK